MLHASRRKWHTPPGDTSPMGLWAMGICCPRYYKDDWQTKWRAAPELPCKECRTQVAMVVWSLKWSSLWLRAWHSCEMEKSYGILDGKKILDLSRSCTVQQFQPAAWPAWPWFNCFLRWKEIDARMWQVWFFFCIMGLETQEAIHSETADICRL